MKNINTIDSGWLEQVTGGAKRTNTVSRLGGTGSIGTLGLGGVGSLGLGGLTGIAGIPGLGLGGNHALLRQQKEQNDMVTAMCIGIACSRR